LNTFLDGENLQEQLINMAKSAENCERYEDMVCFVRARVQKFPDTPLSSDERNLLSVAYKNVIGARRGSCRALADIENSEPMQVTEAIQQFRAVVEEELKTISHDVIGLLENVLLPKGSTGNSQEVVEEKVFYLKMAADYYRYLTESVQGESNKEKTKEYYEKAFKEAAHLDPTHPIRLGLALNFSVCKFEILGQKAEACKMAKEAFDEAISKLDHLAENDYKDSTLIMQLLRDNLTLWRSNTEVEDLDEA